MISAGAAILGAQMLSSASQYAINQANLRNQRNINDTQINLSNTQHQREVADLLLAGLNPILSAQGSGASVPALGVPDQKSIADSLPSSAREFARYQSESYAQSVIGQELQNHYQSIVNSAAENERAASTLRSQIDLEMAEAEQDALRAELGIRYSDSGSTVYFDKKQHEKYLDLVREGIRSDLKNRANSNLRNWIPLMGQGANAVNSGASAAHKLKWLVK